MTKIQVKEKATVSTADVEAVCELLHKAYNSPRLENPYNAVDDLVFITLSNKTSPAIAQAIFNRLKTEFSTWEELLGIGEKKIEQLLRPAGFSRIRASFLFRSLSKIHDDFGACTLDCLTNKPEQEVFLYLISLPGVSNKVAKCIMLYTLGFSVLPVDAHVFRVGKRLGWTTKNRADLSHNELEGIVPERLRYGFHVNALSHGRAVCKPRTPNCQQCCLTAFCDYFLTSQSS